MMQKNNLSISHSFSFLSLQKLLILATIFYVNFFQYKVYENSLILAVLGGGSIVLFGLNLVLSGQFRINKSIGLYIVFMIYMIIPTLLRGVISEYITSLEYTMFMLSIVYVCQVENDVDWLTKPKLLMTILTCVFFLINPVVYYDKINTIQYTLVTKLNPNTFGLDIVFGLWCAIELFSQKKIKVYTFLGCIILFTFSIIKTASRKSLICVGIALVLWIFLYYLKPQKALTSKLLKRVLLIVLIVGVGVLLFNQYFIDSIMEHRLESMLSGNDGSVIKRLEMYRSGFMELLKHPLLGYGFGGYSALYGRYSHATLVEVPFSGGFLAGALYFAILLGEFFRATRRKKRLITDPKGENIVIEHYLCIVLWIMVFFLCVCVIHPYLFNSHVMLAILFAIGIKHDRLAKIEQPGKE